MDPYTRRRFLTSAGLGGAALALGGRFAGPAAATHLGSAGHWSDPAIWGAAGVPGPNDVASITGSVVLDVDAQVAGVDIQPGGQLRFDDAASRTLESTGNVEVYGRLIMRPASAAQTHTLRFLNVDEAATSAGA